MGSLRRRSTRFAAWSTLGKICPAHASPRPPSHRSRPAPTYAPGVDERQILVVEDDEAIGRGLSQALAGQGYAVRWAPSGSDALREATETAPDLILLDLVGYRLERL